MLDSKHLGIKSIESASVNEASCIKFSDRVEKRYIGTSTFTIMEARSVHRNGFGSTLV